MSDVDPETAARMATGGPEAADGAAAVEGEVSSPVGGADPERGDARESGTSLVDALLETTPPGSVAEYPDMPDPAAHALIGAQKFVNGIAGDRDMSGGKPAVVDFLQAAVSFLSSADADEPDDASADTRELVGDTGVPEDE